MGFASATRWDHFVLQPGTYEYWYLKTKQRRSYIYGIAALFGFLFILCLSSVLSRSSSKCSLKRTCPCDLIVPDIIHFYRGDKESMNITNKEAACLRSALRHHGEIMIHSTYPDRSRNALKVIGLNTPKIHVRYPPRGPGPIYMAILREYGGIFLKNDIYLVDRLDAVRGHNFCIIGENDIVAGTQGGAISGFEVKLKGILLDRDYGALYIRDVIKNCTYSAVRLEVR